jgi:radical SAM protein (TIGR01212 family)
MTSNLKWASEYYQETFGGRVQKIPVNAGFTCPNRDGTISAAGCSYCNNESFTPFYADAPKSITEQLNGGIDFFSKRYQINRFFAYFQAFSNTYAPVEVLRNKYAEALNHPKCEGLVIATRPDCLNHEVLALLQELSLKTHVKLELGIESFDDECLQAINRGHSAQVAGEALENLAKANLRVGVHLIFGLPREKAGAPFDAARILGSYEVLFVKLHHLQIVKGSTLAADYEKGSLAFSLLTLDGYLDRLEEFVRGLNRPIYVERLINRVPLGMLLAPRWGAVTESQVKKMLLERLGRG